MQREPVEFDHRLKPQLTNNNRRRKDDDISRQLRVVGAGRPL